MSNMSEYAMEQDEQENESGIDMHDCYHAHYPLEKVDLTNYEKQHSEE